VTFRERITRKEVTENRVTGDFRGARTRKEVALYPEKRGFRPRGISSSKYPEKGDLVFPSIVLNHRPKRDLCLSERYLKNTRKKVTFVVIEARNKNVRKKSKKEMKTRNSDPHPHRFSFRISKERSCEAVKVLT
jgi:hypothetical protein